MFSDDLSSVMPDAPTAYENPFTPPASGMPDAPTSSETFGQAEGGGDVMESSSPVAAALQTFS